MRDLHYASAIEVAQAIRSREISARDHLEALLARVEAQGEAINCVVTVDAERARREADEADAAIGRGESVGPLHGVAMTIKDSFMTRGMRTTSGAPMLSDFVPEVDAVAVGRLRGAGAVVFGKTNLPIWAGDTQSYNEVFGTSNNPWDVSCTVGGSSGGAAGALAAGQTPIELGSDIGGSIRGPASECGVVGHKPSFGIVPATGHIPGPPGSLTQADLAVIGPLARTVDDAELMLDLLAGPDEWHAPAMRLELPPARKREPAGLRVAAWLDDPTSPVDREVHALLQGAAEALADAGAKVDFQARPAFEAEQALTTFRKLLAGAMSGGMPHEAIERWAQLEGDDPVSVVARDQALRHREWLTHHEKRMQLRQRWHEFFADWDVILLPVLPTPAIAHDHSAPMPARTISVNGESRPYLDRINWVGLTGVAYLPATVVPVGTTAGGLPVGVQIAGPYLEDRTTLAVARMLEGLLGGFRRPTGY
jgi:amidase